MSQLKALVFDVDGTLADTERDGHRVAFNAAFAEAGLDWHWSVELYGELLSVTGGKERIRYYLDRYNSAFQRPEDFDAFVAELHKSKTHHYTQLLSEGRIPLRSGVLRLLTEARAAGLRLAIATTTTPANVSALLRYSAGDDAEDWFEVIAAGDIVPAKKPAPDIFVYALEALGLPPSSVIAFEDSAHGLRSALDAGIEAVVVTVNDYTRQQDFSDAALVVDQLGEPGTPVEVIKGPDTVEIVDVNALRKLHARVHG